MEKLCPIHNEPMAGKEGKYGYFWSHKMEDGEWCNGKAKNAPYAEKETKPRTDRPTQYAGQPKEFWDKRSKIIALCGLANAVLSAGGVPDINKLSALLTQIENKAEEMTMDENGPF